MLNKTLPLVGTFFLFIVLATAEVAAAAYGATAAVTPPCTVSVVFENGLSTISKNQGSDFNMSVKIADSPAIDFFSIGIQWNASLIELKDSDTDLDVLTGGFLTFFAGPSAAGTHLAAGYLEDIAGYRTSGSSSGNGTLFIIAFHAKALSPTTNVTIVSPNAISYLSLGATQVNIDAVVDGSVIVIPEFPASALLPLFLVATTVAIAAATVMSRKRRVLPRVSQHE